MFLHSYRICFCRTWSNTHGAFCSFVVPQKLFKDLSNEFCSDLWCQAFQRVWCDWSVWNEVKFSEVFYSEKGKKQCTHNREEKERVLNVDMTLVEKTPVGHFRWRTPRQLERSSSFITFYYHLIILQKIIELTGMALMEAALTEEGMDCNAAWCIWI